MHAVDLGRITCSGQAAKGRINRVTKFRCRGGQPGQEDVLDSVNEAGKQPRCCHPMVELLVPRPPCHCRLDLLVP